MATLSDRSTLSTHSLCCSTALGCAETDWRVGSVVCAGDARPLHRKYSQHRGTIDSIRGPLTGGFTFNAAAATSVAPNSPTPILGTCMCYMRYGLPLRATCAARMCATIARADH